VRRAPFAALGGCLWDGFQRPTLSKTFKHGGRRGAQRSAEGDRVVGQVELVAKAERTSVATEARVAKFHDGNGECRPRRAAGDATDTTPTASGTS
jgi:hypothetical protein